LLVDAAQTLGHLPVDVRAMNIDLLAFPGHKGLLGPLGTGGLYLRPGLEKIVEPIREGGTGSRSEEDVQPDILPDRYEPGSHNAIGLIGLSEGVQWILDRGIDALWMHERRLMEIMLEAFVELPGLRLLGPQTMIGRCGVFSVIDDVLEPAELAAVLEDRFGILTRPGLHCAPHAHTLMDSAQFGGATRFSLGPFLTERDAEAAVEAVSEICLAHQNV
jgi:selenocysteine lyase/cysteine desulfurase